MPSASARCAQLPRCGDKIPFYLALKKFSDCVKEGGLSELNENDFVFFESSNKQGPSGGDPMKRKRPEEIEEFGGVEIPVKKKRGRPRKGMEKATLEAKENKAFAAAKKGKEAKGVTNKNLAELPEGGQQRRKRGRPKKYKPEDQVAAQAQQQQQQTPQPGAVFDVSTSSAFDKKTANAIASTLNAVSSGSSSVSGYSSGTSGSGSSTCEERRENGSMSNAGSSGPSPSHHSFTTQSDLSSEISAAMDLHSCGSTPSSPLNNNNSTNTNSSNNSSTNNNTLSSNIISSSNNGSNSNEQQSLFDPTGGDERTMLLSSKHMLPNSHPHQSMYPSPMDSQTADVASSYPSNMYPPSYSNQGSRLPPLLADHRNQTNSYHSTIPDNGQGPSQQNQQQQQQQGATFNPFESKPQSVVDMAAKSLSGLESLVDQIPSIAEQSEPIGGADPMTHAHTMPPHNSNHYEAASGFLPYGHHHPSHHGSSSYAPSPYYGDFNSTGYPLTSTPYGSGAPPTPSPLQFSYANYPGHYGGGYNHTNAPGLHIPPPSYGGGTPGYSPSPYHHPHHNPYSYSMAQTSPPNGQRFPQRLHQSMDLSHLGF